MNWIDTHTHLYLNQFDEDRKEVIDRAIKNGVSQFLLPNIDSSTMDAVFKMADDYPKVCQPMVGLHPCSVKENWEEELQTLKPYLSRKNVCAVGEIGIDLYWDKSTLGIQVSAFEEQIKWAKETGLPIVIHARDAFDEIFEVLDRCHDDRLSGVFHCFTGDLDQAKKVLSYQNFMMGIGGVATYKKAAMHEVLCDVPLDKLILETDAPYLSPVPYRGKRNESAYMVHTAEKLADIHGVKLDELSEITTANARLLFKNI
jgi:TatD DNase family protein